MIVMDTNRFVTLSRQTKMLLALIADISSCQIVKIVMKTVLYNQIYADTAQRFMPWDFHIGKQVKWIALWASVNLICVCVGLAKFHVLSCWV